jgi:DNA-directed RNA polymerase subunit N (RpoN/RPB10)
VLADKWVAYDKQVKEALDAKKEPAKLHENFGDTFRGKIMDELGIVKQCCRRHMLGHVDLIDII